MRFCRFLDDKERACTAGLLSAVQTHRASEFEQGLASGEVFWLNLHKAVGTLDSAAVGLPEPLLGQVRALCEALRAEVFPDDHLISIGVTVNPPGSKGQDIHLDYGAGFGAVFVTLTDFHFDNTIVSYTPSPTKPTAVLAARLIDGIGEADLLAEHGWMQRTASASRPFAVWAMALDTLHAAVGNTSNQLRALLYVVVAEVPCELSEGNSVLTAGMG